MGKVIDLVGKRFGRLVVLKMGGISPYKQRLWECVCDCGNTPPPIAGVSLREGMTLSCGCLKVEKLLARSVSHGHTRGGKATPTYSTWLAMVKRCTNPNDTHYANYGGRGIAVCERWLEYENFLADMGEKPAGMSIDRHPDTNGDYRKENCRWATDVQQARNKRSNRMIEYRGETRCLAEWAEVLGIPRTAIKTRLRDGWSIEEAFEKPVTGHVNLIEFRGETHSVHDWAMKIGVTPTALYMRLRRGMPIEKALSVTPRTV